MKSLVLENNDQIRHVKNALTESIAHAYEQINYLYSRGFNADVWVKKIEELESLMEQLEQ